MKGGIFGGVYLIAEVSDADRMYVYMYVCIVLEDRFEGD